MIKLYFENVPTVISTILIIAAFSLISLVFIKRNNIENWWPLVLIMFALGLFMSIMSGTKDAMATPDALIALDSWMMILLSVLGGLSVLTGIASIVFTFFAQKQMLWQISFYILSVLIIVMTLITESFRIVNFVNIKKI